MLLALILKRCACLISKKKEKKKEKCIFWWPEMLPIGRRRHDKMNGSQKFSLLESKMSGFYQIPTKTPPTLNKQKAGTILEPVFIYILPKNTKQKKGDTPRWRVTLPTTQVHYLYRNNVFRIRYKITKLATEEKSIYQIQGRSETFRKRAVETWGNIAS